MNRREAIVRVGQIAGSLILGECLAARSWAALPGRVDWTPEDEAFLTLIGDTILPSTLESPGAGSVGIGRFMTWMLSECHPPESTVGVRLVLSEVKARSLATFNRSFSTLASDDRERLLTDYERGVLATVAQGGPVMTPHPFRLVKNLTLLGFFTSEVGATQALHYDPVPGNYRGSVPLGPDDRGG